MNGKLPVLSYLQRPLLLGQHPHRSHRLLLNQSLLHLKRKHLLLLRDLLSPSQILPLRPSQPPLLPTYLAGRQPTHLAHRLRFSQAEEEQPFVELAGAVCHSEVEALYVKRRLGLPPLPPLLHRVSR